MLGSGKGMNMKGSGDETRDGSEMALLWLPGLSGLGDGWPAGSLSSWVLEIY